MTRETRLRSRPRADRRQALTIAASAGLGPALLAACGSDDGSDPAGPGSDEALGTGHTAAEPPRGRIAGTSDVPVGGGVIFPDQQVVVTQPAEGEFRCFTAVCTHQGCIVSSVQAGGIRCECHGSAFSIEDGSPVNPPATVGLAAYDVTVDGEEISIA
jgi:nitrite reductase/ring-hydroxylating ferredoxin subunit